MAKGRMINRAISMSLKFHDLPDDTCRLVATWTIPYLDVHGVFYADPLIVKGMIVPMRMDITPEHIEQYLSEMARVGLIKLYKYGGHIWQYWPGFIDNQAGLRPGKESRPEYPEYIHGEDIALVEQVQIQSGVSPELVRSYSVPITPEKKRREEKGSPAQAPAPRDVLFDAVAEVTSSNPKLLGSRIGKCVSQLAKIGATPEQVHQVAEWYAANDWRGRKGEKLTFSTLSEVWEAGMQNKTLPANGNGRLATDQTQHVPGDMVMLPNGEMKRMEVR